jgi:hypothetical protein
LTGVLASAALPASALGTARIEQPDGSVKSYANVRIVIRDQNMSITPADGKGTLVIGKAACSKIGELVRCLPYDATLQQFGESMHIALRSGSVWLNPSKTSQQLPSSSTQLPPHGVILAMNSKRGTYVSLTGTVDQVIK